MNLTKIKKQTLVFDYNIIKIKRRDEKKILNIIKLFKLNNLVSSEITDFFDIKITYPITESILNKCFLLPKVLNNIINEYITDILDCKLVCKIEEDNTLLIMNFFINGIFRTESISFSHILNIKILSNRYSIRTRQTRNSSFFDDKKSHETRIAFADHLSFVNEYFFWQYNKKFFIKNNTGNPYKYSYNRENNIYYCETTDNYWIDTSNGWTLYLVCNLIRKIKNKQHLEVSGKIISSLNKKIKNIMKILYKHRKNH
jgi:hypothetical protein